MQFVIPKKLICIDVKPVKNLISASYYNQCLNWFLNLNIKIKKDLSTAFYVKKQGN